MEPEVRYCTTSDGVRIAYSVIGEGPPHVYVADPLGSHVELVWSHPVFQPLLVELARENTLITYDPRGVGLSDRVYPSSVEQQQLDLQAVVDRVGLKAFALSATQSMTPMALTFTARHSAVVQRLVLVDGFVRIADYLGTDQARALISLASTDYIMATEVLGALVFGTGREESRDHGAFIRACADPELFSRVLDLLPVDASHDAAELTVPTLVLHHRDLTYVTDAMTRELGALIPTSRVSLVDGRWADNPVGLAERIAAFINDSPVGETGAPEAGASPALAPGTAVILFADIADSTALTEQMGDAAFRERSRRLDDGIRAAVRAAGGTPVEGRVLGDGVMGVFTSAALAIEAALRCLELSVATDLQLHVGLHAGDVLREKHNVYGGAVNIASRICALSDPNEILVSQTIRELARTSTNVAFEDRGEHSLKGVADPVRVFAVRR